MTKQEQKDLALKEYDAITDPAWEECKATTDPAWKKYEATKYQAWEEYDAKCKKIDEQEEYIKIIDGKIYKLIKE